MLVTRPERQAEQMVAALRAHGAEPVTFPATRIDPPGDGGAALARAARDLERFDWVVASSANAVERLAVAAEAAGLDRAALGVPRWGCVGPGTAGALRDLQVEPAVVAERYHAEGLLEALPLAGLRGKRVLLPLAAGARAILREGLEAAGAEVTAVEAYRSVPDGRGARGVRERLHRGEIDVVTFTASSSVEAFIDTVGRDTGGALVAVIGPATGATAESMGMQVGVVARQHTIEGLIESLLEHYRKEAERSSA